jgi:hypothetical protein
VEEQRAAVLERQSQVQELGRQQELVQGPGLESGLLVLVLVQQAQLEQVLEVLQHVRRTLIQ